MEAIKLLISIMCTGATSNKIKMDIIDVKRAYVHADALRYVYVKVPGEDQEEGTCGKLIKAMYGTRVAASNWERAYINFLKSNGFRSGKVSPCVFYHEEKELRLVVHGDDFTITGPESQLDWFR